MSFNHQDTFADRVRALVGQIPQGRVMTYGQIAALCGNARAARIVGGIAHYSDDSLPWYRVVNQQGGLAAGYPGGRSVQSRLLQSDGIKVVDSKINITIYLWRP